MTPPDDAATDDAPSGNADSESSDEGGLTRRDTLAIGGTALGATALATGGTIVGAQEDDSDDGGDDGGTGGSANTFRVTVTNLTSGQPFTPPAVALHSADVEVFSVGETANEAVQQLAENGNLDPLVTLVEDTPEIYAAGVGDAPLVPSGDPGDTGNPYFASFDVEADPAATHLTFLSMLIATNDGFVGLDTVALPEAVNESKTLHADAYDAGTEENTEVWTDMAPPGRELISGGPPAAGTTESDPELAEDGVIHPHSGISGDGDLDVETYGWDEPAGVVHVEKIAEDREAPDDVGDDGNQTDADGNATDGDGNVTDDGGNVTDDTNGNVTDGADGNATDGGDGNVTDGSEGNATDGIGGNATDGETNGTATNGTGTNGNLTDGNG